MLKKDHGKIHVRRRDFLKTAAVAGMAATLPVTGMYKQDPETINSWYNRLADSLNMLPNSFPRTESNIEITLLKKIFLPEEAFLAGLLKGKPEPVNIIAQRAELTDAETANRLTAMMERGFVSGNSAKGLFRLSPFVVGIYESQLDRMDHELAHLVEEYFDQGGIDIMRPQPAIHRVIPAQSAVKTEWILPYDKLRELLMSCNTFRVRDCICRKQQDLEETRKCTFPLHVELIFYKGPEPTEPPSPPFVTREEALRVLDETEKIGLVHTVSNVAEGVIYVCNCCGCCCGILRGITEFGIEKSVAAANYYSVIDPGKCTGCGTCITRCQMHAISADSDQVSVVNRTKCIGCGLCVTGCTFNVARLERKAEEEIINPPKDYATWE
ncbi:MAG TPA: 4Fe-4S binding protein, partial [Bacteroidales bacterium]|nr:4Fe-4S binding protein [Bacteroidales bacterium]